MTLVLCHSNWEIIIFSYYAGLSNGAAPEDGLFSSDRRTGRKGRRHRSNNKFLDGKYQVMSSEKENIVGNSHVNVEEPVRYVDGVPLESGNV